MTDLDLERAAIVVSVLWGLALLTFCTLAFVVRWWLHR